MIDRNLSWAHNYQASIYWQRPPLNEAQKVLDEIIPRHKGYTVDDLKAYFSTLESETDTSP
ncbi:hypothetical protein THF5H11_10228 [Vibrio jasicida]|uniref:hypothetical protein n=1 Tax=Vibrio jasicida TaxID=766224 RepID=UPI000A9ECF41|nr:hypothetical protein THF5H11_10228 [Vibrio jasicida]